MVTSTRRPSASLTLRGETLKLTSKILTDVITLLSASRAVVYRF